MSVPFAILGDTIIKNFDFGSGDIEDAILTGGSLKARSASLNNAKIGLDNIFGRECVVSKTAFIGNNKVLMSLCKLGDDVGVGNGVTIGTKVTISNGATLDNGCDIGEGSCIGDKVSIGKHCVVFKGSEVFKGAVIEDASLYWGSSFAIDHKLDGSSVEKPFINLEMTLKRGGEPTWKEHGVEGCFTTEEVKAKWFQLEPTIILVEQMLVSTSVKSTENLSEDFGVSANGR